MPPLAEHDPLNRLVLTYYAGRNELGSPAIAAPDSVRDPYLGQGSHPDIVERVWDQLGPCLPADCRCLVHGSPALVHATAGIVMAAALGTQYLLRLPPTAVADAVAAGARLTTTWASGQVLDVRRSFGPDWVYGGWLKAEPDWCRELYDLLAARPPAE